jgi:hypothetical protein
MDVLAPSRTHHREYSSISTSTKVGRGSSRLALLDASSLTPVAALEVRYWSGMTWDERVPREKYSFIGSSTDMASLVTVEAGTNIRPLIIGMGAVGG